LTSVIVFSTCGTGREASRIARELVRTRLAACVNILPISSFYRWKGRIQNESERLLIIKTRSEIFAKVRARIVALNSYEVPEVVCLKISGGLPTYLRWIDDETRTT